MQLSNLITAASAISAAAAAAAAALAHGPRSCETGSYQCLNPVGAPSTIHVCSGGAWVATSTCEPDWQCLQDVAGGVTCLSPDQVDECVRGDDDDDG